MTRHVVRVAALTAEDDQHRVVYDDRRNRVTDPRDRRIRSFRVRWYVSDGGTEQARTRRFPTHALDQAEGLLVELRRLRDEEVPVADDGLAPATATPTVPSSLAATDVAAAIDRFLDVVPLESRNAGSYQTNLNLFRDCLHVQPDGEVRYDPDSEAPLIGWADLTPEVCEDILLIRRHLSIPAWRTHQRQLARHQRWVAYAEAPVKPKGHPPARVDHPGDLEPQLQSPETEDRFSVIVNRCLNWAAARGYLERNPWTAVQSIVRSPNPAMITPEVVPDIDQTFAMADHIARTDGSSADPEAAWATAVLLRVWAVTGLRVEEMWALQAEDVRQDQRGVHLLVQRAEVEVSSTLNRRQPGQPTELRELKGKRPREHRQVPVPVESVARNLVRFACAHPAGTRLVAAANGAPISRRDWTARWFAPARDAVLPAALQHITPRWMRHAAVTWWLESGMPVDQAARRAGNTPATILGHYASVTQSQQELSDDQLRANGPRPRLAIVDEPSA